MRTALWVDCPSLDKKWTVKHLERGTIRREMTPSISSGERWWLWNTLRCYAGTLCLSGFSCEHKRTPSKPAATRIRRHRRRSSKYCTGSLENIHRCRTTNRFSSASSKRVGQPLHTKCVNHFERFCDH